MSSSEHGKQAMESATLEVRYADAFLLWDRAGKVWDTIAAACPGVVLKNAEPRQTTFQLRDEFELRVEFNRLVVIYIGSEDGWDAFKDVATTVVDSAVRNLELRDFSRVGLRVNYWQAMDSCAAAVRTFMSSNLLQLPRTRVLGENEEVKALDYVARWETANAGITIACRVLERKQNLEVPIQVRRFVELTKQGGYGILQDVDYYTVGITSAEQIRPRLWIDQGLKAIRKALRSVRPGDL
jgi:hypothetical protein